MMQFIYPLYWFSFQPAQVEGLYGKIILGFFLGLFLLGIISRIVTLHRTRDRYVKRIGKRFFVFFLTMGFLGVILYFFSYEHIRFFGGRFWYPLWGVGFFLWLIVLVKFLWIDLPRMREQDMREHAKSKYFPRCKN